MSDDEVDHDLLAFMRAHLTPSAPTVPPATTNVLPSALHIVDNSIDVHLSREHILAAADNIYSAMQKRDYSTQTWSSHSLHPQTKDASTVDYIFTLDLLNFCFWSFREEESRFNVEYKGKRYTGYWSLVALLNRALEEGVPVTSPWFWVDRDVANEETWERVFRSATREKMPLMQARIDCLREAGEVLCERYDGSFVNMIEKADGSAEKLVCMLAEEISCFDDSRKFKGKKVNFYKRAQILVADLWACFNGESYGHFADIDKLTMFADYRVPCTLQAMSCLQYAPTLENHIKDKHIVESGSDWEIQIRGASIWCVEMIRREILKKHPDTHINAVLLDYYLYDTGKEMEAAKMEILPHHRTLSIWY